MLKLNVLMLVCVLALSGIGAAPTGMSELERNDYSEPAIEVESPSEYEPEHHHHHRHKHTPYEPYPYEGSHPGYEQPEPYHPHMARSMESTGAKDFGNYPDDTGYEGKPKKSGYNPSPSPQYQPKPVKSDPSVTYPYPIGEPTVPTYHPLPVEPYPSHHKHESSPEYHQPKPVPVEPYSPYPKGKSEPIYHKEEPTSHSFPAYPKDKPDHEYEPKPHKGEPYSPYPKPEPTYHKEEPSTHSPYPKVKPEYEPKPKHHKEEPVSPYPSEGGKDHYVSSGN